MLAVIVCEYAVPTVGTGSEAGPIASTGQIFSVVVTDPVQELASVAVTVKVVPAPVLAVGVPLITPVLVEKDRPAGSVPLVIAKVTGDAPPLCVIVVE